MGRVSSNLSMDGSQGFINSHCSGMMKVLRSCLSSPINGSCLCWRDIDSWPWTKMASISPPIGTCASVVLLRRVSAVTVSSLERSLRRSSKTTGRQGLDMKTKLDPLSLPVVLAPAGKTRVRHGRNGRRQCKVRRTVTSPHLRRTVWRQRNLSLNLRPADHHQCR